MNLCRLLFVCFEIYEIVNSLNPSSMRYIFEMRKSNRVTCDIYKLNLKINRRYQLKFSLEETK